MGHNCNDQLALLIGRERIYTTNYCTVISHDTVSVDKTDNNRSYESALDGQQELFDDGSIEGFRIDEMLIKMVMVIMMMMMTTTTTTTTTTTKTTTKTATTTMMAMMATMMIMMMVIMMMIMMMTMTMTLTIMMTLSLVRVCVLQRAYEWYRKDVQQQRREKLCKST